MAFIPDDAVDRMTELSAGAWRLYCFLARCRNQKTGKCCPSVGVTMEAIGTKRSQAFELRKELVKAGWATFDGSNVITLFGFNSPENRTADTESKVVATDSPENRTDIAQSPENRTVSPENRTPESGKSDSIVRKIGLAYKEEPAKEPANRTSKEEQDMSNSRSADVREVYEYWKTTLNHPRAVLDSKREGFVRARLKAGFSVEDLKAAINGCRASPWHMGQNPNGTVWDDLTLICRDATHVEMFIAKGTNNNGTYTNGKQPGTQKTTEQLGIRPLRQIP